MVRLTVVTVFKFGDISELEKTVDSVKNQKYLPWEHILVISGSEEDSPQISSLSWSRSRFIVNQDKSLYDAMNIGLSQAEGEAIIFLNGGDKFARDNVVEIITDNMISRKCLCFRTLLLYKDDAYLRPKSDRMNELEKFPGHQGFVAPLPEAKEHKFHGELKPITADLDWMKSLMQRCGFKAIPTFLSAFTLGGVSSKPSLKSIWTRFNERNWSGGTKEVLKYLIYKILGARKFYRLIYRWKYDCVNIDDLIKSKTAA